MAHNVFLESLRRRPPRDLAPPPAPGVEDEEAEREYECLESCIAELPPEGRELVLEYYRSERREKIDRRKELAARLGIAPNALRIRVHRLRAALQECVRECLARAVPA